MNKEEMNKYAYELMVKNNPEEAVKQLMLLDKLKERIEYLERSIERQEEKAINNYNDYIGEVSKIDKAIKYIEEWQKFPHTNGTTHEELRNLKEILKGVKDD